jgi:hypothetical protein
MVSPDKIDRRVVRRRQLPPVNLKDLARDPHVPPLFLFLDAVWAGASSLRRLPAENLLRYRLSFYLS